MNVPVSKNNKSLQKSIISIAIVVLFAGGIILSYFYGQLAPAKPDVSGVELFDIESGSTPGEIAGQLERQGLIKNADVFLLYSRLVGKIDKFKAGQYFIDPSFDAPKIMDIIEKGKVATMSFTILEGYDLRQIANVLIAKGITTDEEYWKVVQNHPYVYSFLQDLPEAETRLEGYLFPDTYIIPMGMRVENVVDVMLRRFEQIYKRMPQNQTGLSMHEVVTLASIIEGESLLDKERPLIASVFLNRLKIGMKLDSCATIQYILGERKERLLYSDLEIKSDYNTYLNKGLPPGPIGSPGEASIRAVLEAEDTKYMYFVAKKDGSGEHVFSKTLQEHNRNKNLLGY